MVEKNVGVSVALLETSLGSQARRGKIVKLGRKKLAVYRDRKGRVKKMSAVCTPVGCLVRWNQAEATGDCPCHGSRFNPMGKVVAGPAEHR